LRDQPARSRAFGAPISNRHGTTLPSGPLTSIWIHEWGLINSTFATVPSSFTGAFASNSAVNAWCAHIGAASRSAAAEAAITANLVHRAAAQQISDHKLEVGPARGIRPMDLVHTSVRIEPGLPGRPHNNPPGGLARIDDAGTITGAVAV